MLWGVRLLRKVWAWILIGGGLCGSAVAQCRFMPIDSLPLPLEQPALVYSLQDNQPCRQWVDSVMGRMSLKERIGQLFIYTIAP